jgi:hypothetical protein
MNKPVSNCSHDRPVEPSEGMPSSATTDQKRFELSEPGTVTVAALLHLVRLMGAEIVLARSDFNLEVFEQAVRAKLKQFNSPTANRQAIDDGLSFAKSLVEDVLSQIRAQATIRRKLRTPGEQITRSSGSEELPKMILLN